MSQALVVGELVSNMTDRQLSDAELSVLERLAKLRADGVLTDEEFSQQKQILFSSPRQQARVAYGDDDRPTNYRPNQISPPKRWSEVPASQLGWVAMLWILLIWPVGMYFMWRGPIYINDRGKAKLIPTKDKILLTVLTVSAAVWMVLLILNN